MRKMLGILILQFIVGTSYSQIKVTQLFCDNLTNPIGIDNLPVQFNWQLLSEKRNAMQSAYEIRVDSNVSLLEKDKNLKWSSGKVQSLQSVHVNYEGLPLQSDTRYFWQVRVWDNSNKASAWSKPAFFHTAFLHKDDWKAKWIEPGYNEDSIFRPSPLFRKEFTSNKKIVSATAYVTAHGLYEAFINGQRIGDAYLTPGWTSYNKRLQYQVYDVANLLQNGSNTIGVTLGSGWYRGSLAWEANRNIYGKDIALLFQINIIYSDGSKGNSYI